MSTRTFLVRLTDEEHEALTELAATEHRSMQDVVRLAIKDRVEQSERRTEVRATLSEIIDRDAELLDRLAR
ncbi:ribbon-helix-helix protein, CopG family [Microlunatus elymi]|uniref:Ribbon-helix-helix protein, CopG family n=1 Tax=Microlunatus elymi TaxID=2596828 RepID=A0A516PX02_9ACTN|nr:ribbon-helix-helix protein, CopG family [Microlunatus elymi]QDP95708.1 ribbon-helix-helix protein, CopG family [Microlunatus elymi]